MFKQLWTKWHWMQMVMLLLVTLPGYAQLTDPTAPSEDTGAVLANINVNGLQLNAVIGSDKQRSAIINNQVVQIGGSVSGYKVVDIQPQFVVLQTASNKTVTLQLTNDNIKRPASTT